MLRDVIALGLFIAVIIIILRVIIGSPLVQHIRETFASPSSLSNSNTRCPPGSQVYMYKGASFCCSGQINTDANLLRDSCRPSGGRDASVTFCTLGPAVSDNGQRVPNCMENRTGMMQGRGDGICPSNLPTYVEKPTGEGRCCADPGNEERTECRGTELCDVIAGKNFFTDPKSCQFRRAQEDDGACPVAFSPFTAAGPPQGPLSNLTLYGCTNSKQNCYSDGILKRLRELGYDVAGLPSCSNLTKGIGLC